MKIRKKTLIRIIVFIATDLLLALMLVLYFYTKTFHDMLSSYIIFSVLLIILMRSVYYFIRSFNFYKDKSTIIAQALYDFRKGKFILPEQRLINDEELADLYDEIRKLGRHLDSIFMAQKEEIEKFNDLYNSLILSLSSYFLVLNEYEKIVFATEGFCNKFQFDHDEIKGKRIDDIFYFVNARLKGGIKQVRDTGESIILEKTHLLSINKVSIIADIKISSIIVQGRRETILLIDDVTNKLRKDYQISLMNQISESIQHDAEIERVLYTI